MSSASLSRLFPSSRFGAIRSSAPLSTGLSGSEVHAVTTDAGEFVLRVHGSGADAWHALLHASRLAADHGIAPPLVHVDEAERAAVSVKVAGAPFATALAQPALRSQAIRSVVDQLARLHAIAVESATPRDPVALARSIWSEQAQRPGFPAWAELLGEKIEAAGSALARDTRRAFSHNDVHPGNLMWDGARVWLIDWERAGLSHPYSDLATFSNFLNLPNDAALGLLALQEQSPIDDENRATFLCLRAYSRVVYGAVFLRLVPDLGHVATTIASRADAPTLAECYERMRSGALDPKSGEGQALLGAAFLKQAASTTA